MELAKLSEQASLLIRLSRAFVSASMAQVILRAIVKKGPEHLPPCEHMRLILGTHHVCCIRVLKPVQTVKFVLIRLGP
eukprot:CAMPEP_0183366174 /NCGR_PEP_ID=MMETSP0164_2-20130417/87665_1 /TAXON_ID=221442 /ORGANISM="Coccolithus pelagicus ssp braarudi, Strain PLY182g" /LENGTH=77 /DNA_ID=CAMNT_0025541851 /DNA_START=21 /DNA_END=251 /DNA_ORIENTATION=+